jgi:hypothetical protein
MGWHEFERRERRGKQGKKRKGSRMDVKTLIMILSKL